MDNIRKTTPSTKAPRTAAATPKAPEIKEPEIKQTEPTPPAQESADSYAEKLPDKISEIINLWKRLCHLNWSGEAFQILQRLAGNLASIGKSSGDTGVSETARQLASFVLSVISSGRAPNDEQRRRIAVLIDALTQSASCTDQMAATHGSAPASGTMRGPLIYILDDDAVVSGLLTQQCQVAGYHARSFPTLEAITAACANSTPAAIILDASLPEGNLAGIDSIRDLRAKIGQRISALVVSARTDITARLQAVRADADAYFTKPVDMPRLLSTLAELAPIGVPPDYRVMIIDDDRQLAEHYAAVLNQAGMSTRIVDKPLQTLQAIADFQPEMLLMDINMPDCSGLELAELIHQDEALLGLPIMFLSAVVDAEVQHKAAMLSGNEFFDKAIPGAELVNAVRNRARQARRRASRGRGSSRWDPVTDLLSSEAFFTEVEIALASSAGRSTCRSLVVININDFNLKRSQVGITHLNTFLKQIGLRIQQIIGDGIPAGHVTEGTFALLAGDNQHQSAADLATLVTRAISGQAVSTGSGIHTITCSAGIAHITSAALTIQQLFSAAGNAADLAQSTGRYFEIAAPVIPAEKSDGATASTPAAETGAGFAKQSLRLAFQGVYCLDGEADPLYEVMLRMISADNHILRPDQFLPDAKQRGILPMIDLWVIEQVVALLASEHTQETRSRFIIRLSNESLTDPGTVSKIDSLLNSAPLSREHSLIFQLAEDAVAQHTTNCKAMMVALNKLGCGFALSHFGCTRHGKTLLKTLPIDFVKVQGKFVNDSATQPGALALLRETVAAAMERNHEVIVGSVEQACTLSLLVSWGVSYFQGYFIKKPTEELDFDSDQISMGGGG